MNFISPFQLKYSTLRVRKQNLIRINCEDYTLSPRSILETDSFLDFFYFFKPAPWSDPSLDWVGSLLTFPSLVGLSLFWSSPSLCG